MQNSAFLPLHRLAARSVYLISLLKKSIFAGCSKNTRARREQSSRSTYRYHTREFELFEATPPSQFFQQSAMRCSTIQTLAAVCLALIMLTASTAQGFSPAFVTVRDLGLAYDPDRKPLARLYPGQEATVDIPIHGCIIYLVGQRSVSGTLKQTTRRFEVKPLEGGGFHFEQKTRPPDLSVLPVGLHGVAVTDSMHKARLIMTIQPESGALLLELSEQAAAQ